MLSVPEMNAGLLGLTIANSSINLSVFAVRRSGFANVCWFFYQPIFDGSHFVYGRIFYQ